MSNLGMFNPHDSVFLAALSEAPETLFPFAIKFLAGQVMLGLDIDGADELLEDLLVLYYENAE